MKRIVFVWALSWLLLYLALPTTVGIGESVLTISDSLINTGYTRIYINELEEPVPYLVTDYGGDQALLIREHVLCPPMRFSDNWDLPAAYPNSNVDCYLNTVFLERFDDGIIKEINDAMIDVTDPDSLGRGRSNTKQIQRRVFLLSYTEVGGTDVSICPKEGKMLNNLPEGWLIATDDEGKISAWWLRTAITWNYDIVNVVYPDGGINGFGVWGDNAPACLGIRPAFIMSKNINLVRFKDGYCIDC